MFLLDTCVFSEFSKPIPHESVLAWARSVPMSQQYLSLFVLGELLRGIALMPDGRRKHDLAEWVETLEAEHHERTIGLDMDVIRCWAEITASAERKGTPPPAMDSLIAAQCFAHNLTLVTRNDVDFVNLGVRIHNPWKSKGL